MSALTLNALFRLGVRRTRTLRVDPARLDAQAIADFMEEQGAAWGARRDVIDRATFNLSQSIETIVESCAPEGPIEVAASFDEFNLNLRVSYNGPALERRRAGSGSRLPASDRGGNRCRAMTCPRAAGRTARTARRSRSGAQRRPPSSNITAAGGAGVSSICGESAPAMMKGMATLLS